jgi:hypothetical protein
MVRVRLMLFDGRTKFVRGSEAAERLADVAGLATRATIAAMRDDQLVPDIARGDANVVELDYWGSAAAFAEVPRIVARADAKERKARGRWQAATGVWADAPRAAAAAAAAAEVSIVPKVRAAAMKATSRRANTRRCIQRRLAPGYRDRRAGN